MTMKKKLWITAVSVVGAAAIFAQAVWADGKDTGTANVPAQAAADDHAVHHPDGTAAPAGMMDQSGMGSMGDMMKMMGDGNMGDMMKMMGDGNMAEMMKMMQTPEGKAMMDQCLELMKQQQPAAAVQ